MGGEIMKTKGKIKVLECIRQGKIGGGESHLLNLVENLDRELFDPIVLSFTDGPMIDRLKQMGVETHVIFTEKPFDVTKWGRVRRLLKDSGVDLIHAHGTRAGSNVLWAARSLGIPVVYTIHGWSFHPDQQRLLRRMRIMGERYITSRTAVNISVSDANRESGRQEIPGFKSIRVNYGIDQKKFSPKNIQKDVRAELGIPAEALLVLFIARFTVQKQPLAMVRAFRKALPQVPGMHLLMVGDGELKEEVLQAAKGSDLEGLIHFESFRQDVPDVLAAADIFVLPSLWEGLPIGLLEAMAMGKAIIASDVDGTGEVLRNDENGILVSTDNLVERLTAALVGLGKDGDRRKRFEREAVVTVNEKFNVIHMTHNIEQVYTEVLTNQHGKNGI
jgi:glycosyltransferase involved in cell wall biosynthesis